MEWGSPKSSDKSEKHHHRPDKPSSPNSLKNSVFVFFSPPTPPTPPRLTISLDSQYEKKESFLFFKKKTFCIRQTVRSRDRRLENEIIRPILETRARAWIYQAIISHRAEAISQNADPKSIFLLRCKLVPLTYIWYVSPLGAATAANSLTRNTLPSSSSSSSLRRFLFLIACPHLDLPRPWHLRPSCLHYTQAVPKNAKINRDFF